MLVMKIYYEMMFQDMYDDAVLNHRVREMPPVTK